VFVRSCARRTPSTGQSRRLAPAESTDGADGSRFDQRRRRKSAADASISRFGIDPGEFQNWHLLHLLRSALTGCSSTCSRRRDAEDSHASGPQVPTELVFISRPRGVIVEAARRLHASSLIAPEPIHVVLNFAEHVLFVTEDEIRRRFTGRGIMNVLFLSNLLFGEKA
jgi:hypothetical protein